MSAQNSAGIQTLLDAEREAQKIVQRAREYRVMRIRDAKSEAWKEIEDYRNQKEDEYNKFKDEHSEGFKAAEKESNSDAGKQLQAIQTAGEEHGDTVVEKLMKAMTDVKPQVPEKIAA